MTYRHDRRRKELRRAPYAPPLMVLSLQGEAAVRGIDWGWERDPDHPNWAKLEALLKQARPLLLALSEETA